MKKSKKKSSMKISSSSQHLNAHSLHSLKTLEMCLVLLFRHESSQLSTILSESKLLTFLWRLGPCFFSSHNIHCLLEGLENTFNPKLFSVIKSWSVFLLINFFGHPIAGGFNIPLDNSKVISHVIKCQGSTTWHERWNIGHPPMTTMS